AQRIQLATSLGSHLVGALYVLDEPSIGLHPRDTQRLIDILKSLRDLGNTVLVVEHDPETIQAADHVIDLGPGAGELGGKLLFAGPYAALLDRKSTRLNSSHVAISYAVFCLKKKKKYTIFLFFYLFICLPLPLADSFY